MAHDDCINQLHSKRIVLKKVEQMDSVVKRKEQRDKQLDNSEGGVLFIIRLILLQFAHIYQR